jgi:hypothetical protein
VNWFEIQRLLTWTYVGSTAIAQDMDKVLLDADVLLHPPQAAAEGSTEDEELVKKAGAVYVFEEGASRIPSRGLSYLPNTSSCRLARVLMVDFEVFKPHLQLQAHIMEHVTYSPPTRRR